MDRLGLTVRTAGPADVDAIVGLLDLAYDTTGAGLGQRFTPGQVARYVAGSACALAVSDGRALGVLVTQPVPAGDEDGPITRAMVDAFPPPAGCYVYGPIAVDPAARGSGVGRLMANWVHAAFADRTGYLFVDDRNTASLRLHDTPPFQRIGTFRALGRGFICLLLPTRDPAISRPEPKDLA